MPTKKLYTKIKFLSGSHMNPDKNSQTLQQNVFSVTKKFVTKSPIFYC